MDELQSKRQTWLICLGLTALVLLAYAPLWQCGFVLYDDNFYVTDNDMVKQGMTGRGILWAFSTVCAGNWHPLTWISHMLDCQFYGLNPAGHHSTNLLLHIANCVLLFLLLQRLTRSRWPCALVAAFFALHPMHVESVVWVSERKDVLSTFFWLLAVGAYVRYVEKAGRWFYAGSLALFALGLMAKPMLVTLPAVLMLLDYWPLQRWRRPIGPLLLEKTPFFMLAGISCWITLLAQQRGGAVVSLEKLSSWARLENVPVAYSRYLGKTFWPADLGVLYPLSWKWPVWEVAGAILLLASVTVWAVWRRRTEPFLLAGWLWFIVMLTPVIGLVQVGAQSMADRYHYLAGAGLFIMVIWALWRRIPAAAWAIPLAGCMVLTSQQVRYWSDSETLFRHTLAVTANNSVMESDLGRILFQQGRLAEALPHAQRAVALAPTFALARYNLGNILLGLNRVPDALAQFEIQVKLDPGDPVAQFKFGDVLLKQGLAEDAMPHLQKAVELRPGDAASHDALAAACRETGRAALAISQYEKSLALDPSDARAAAGLAWMLAASPDAAVRNGARAVRLALLANRVSGGKNASFLGVLAAAYAEAGDFPDAMAAAQGAWQLAGEQGQTALAGALRKQLAGYRAHRPFRDVPPGAR
jgi:Flp pilus assembly protein TadD